MLTTAGVTLAARSAKLTGRVWSIAWLAAGCSALASTIWARLSADGTMARAPINIAARPTVTNNRLRRVSGDLGAFAGRIWVISISICGRPDGAALERILVHPCHSAMSAGRLF